ncbi:MAG: hypothetical protein LBQ95_03260 [Lachnospiraceae bacterium]|jgi:cell division protein FtsL|nr:hypothetical protein [Lachnospiraceae bacterium]
MAARNNYKGSERNYYENNSRNKAYIYGSAVPKRLERPERKEDPRQVRVPSKAQRKSSAHTKMFVMALIMIMGVAVGLIYLQAQNNAMKSNVSVLQEELKNLREENNNRYHSLNDNINLDAIKDRAVNGLGMTAVTPEQVIDYDNPVSDYIQQNAVIPTSGALSENN